MKRETSPSLAATLLLCALCNNSKGGLIPVYLYRLHMEKGGKKIGPSLPSIARALLDRGLVEAVGFSEDSRKRLYKISRKGVEFCNWTGVNHAA